MKRSPRSVYRPHPAVPHAGAAWRSLLLTLGFLLGLAIPGHMLGVYRAAEGGESCGLRVVSIPHQEPHNPELPGHASPTEQSTPDIPFSEPQFLTVAAEIPDICTTPEEEFAQLPLIDFPDSLGGPTETQRKPKQQAPPRRARPAASTAQVEHTNSADSATATTTPPAYKSAPPPPYPAELRASRTRGTVRVRITVNTAGEPTAVHIISGSGHRLFDTTATNWILRHWRFHPATRSGTPVESCVSTRVEFVLDNA